MAIRRERLATGLIGLLLLLTTACSGSTEVESAATQKPDAGAAVNQSDVACDKGNGPVTLRVQTWVQGTQEAAELWNTDHPDVQVTVEYIPNAEYAKYTTALAAQNAPDIAQIEFQAIPQFLATQSLQDISNCPGVQEASKAFPQFALDQVSLGQPGLFAIPQDIGPMALFYNKRVFDEAGLAAPKTWTEYADAAKVLSEKIPGTKIAGYPADSMVGLYQQAGANPVTYEADGSVGISFDTDPAIKQVNTLWQQLLDDQLVDTQRNLFSPDFYKALTNGQIATWPCAVWCSATISGNAADASGDWAMAPLPTWDGGAAGGIWGGSTSVVFNQSKHPAESAEFITWLNTDPRALTLMVEASGIYPAATSVEGVEALSQPLSYYGGQTLLDTFKDIVPTVKPGFAYSPANNRTQDAFADTAAGVVSGAQTLDEAMIAVQQATIDGLRDQQIPVTTK